MINIGGNQIIVVEAIFSLVWATLGASVRFFGVLGRKFIRRQLFFAQVGLSLFYPKSAQHIRPHLQGQHSINQLGRCLITFLKVGKFFTHVYSFLIY